MYVCMYVCMYACMYVCMYVYMYVCNRSPTLAHKKKNVRVVNVPTDFGRVRVTIVGDESSHARMVTYHDVGTNHRSCFGSIGHFLKSDKLLDMFCVFHIDAPGQEDGADEFEENVSLKQ
jgi:hypothetical protein